MVDVITVVKYYKCGNCYKEYNNEELAKKCCVIKETDYTKVNIFEIKKEHLLLLKNMNIEWNDCEFGAPKIDPKRPYGNSDVIEDIREILKIEKTKDNYVFSDEEYKSYFIDKITDLHKQMLVVMEIIFTTQKVELGKYQKISEYPSVWKKII